MWKDMVNALQNYNGLDSTGEWMNVGGQWNEKMKMANDYSFFLTETLSLWLMKGNGFTSLLFFIFQFQLNEAEKQEHFEFQHKSSNDHYHKKKKEK